MGCEELLRNIEKDLPETVTVTPINKKAKKTSKEPSEDVEKDLIELKNSSEVNNMKTILKDAETPNTLNSAAKTIKSAKLSSKKNVFVVQRINESGAPSVGSFVVEKLNSSAVTSLKNGSNQNLQTKKSTMCAKRQNCRNLYRNLAKRKNQSKNLKIMMMLCRKMSRKGLSKNSSNLVCANHLSNRHPS